jgi:predicted aspartyl protease
MRGRVASDGREAMLPLTVIGSSGILAEVEAIVDTGFTGSLCLPPDVVRYHSCSTSGTRTLALLILKGLAPAVARRARSG